MIYSTQIETSHPIRGSFYVWFPPQNVGHPNGYIAPFIAPFNFDLVFSASYSVTLKNPSQITPLADREYFERPTTRDSISYIYKNGTLRNNTTPFISFSRGDLLEPYGANGLVYLIYACNY